MQKCQVTDIIKIPRVFEFSADNASK